MELHCSEKTLDLRHLPNVREDLNRPLQPEVFGLDIQLLYRLIEQGSKEGSGCGDEILYSRDSGISIGVNHPKRGPNIPTCLIGCWTPDGVRIIETPKRDTKDSCWPFSSVRHRVGYITLVLNDRVCSMLTISALVTGTLFSAKGK